MDCKRKKQINYPEINQNTQNTAKPTQENPNETSKSFLNVTSAKNFEKYEVIVDNSQLQKEMRLIEWRSKAELPLVKILFYKILQKKLLNECSVVQVAIETFTHNLQTLPKMGFYAILYLLKEALIGFQRLYDRFGPFEVSHRMVLINKNNKCRVWINDNITLNFPGKKAKITENQFLGRILKIFEEKCTRSIMVIDLFEKIAGFEKLVHAMHFLETYLRGNRIILPSHLIINVENLNNAQNMVKSPKNATQIQQNPFSQSKNQIYGVPNIKKIPKFILSLRQQRNVETSIDKQTVHTPKQVKRNVSHVKILNKSVSRAYIHKQSSLSQQKPNSNSLISNISQKYTSNMQKSNCKIISRTSLRNLIKQSSQEYLNLFMALASRKTIQPSQRLHKRPSLKQQEKQFKKQLHQYQQSQTYLKVPLIGIRENQIASAKYLLCSVNCPQQTATTVNQSSITQMQPKSPQIKQQPYSSREIEQTSIFQKNGWMRRVNNLTQDEFCKEMTQSQHEGTQIFSQQYARTGQELSLLGALGKEVKRSLISQL